MIYYKNTKINYHGSTTKEVAMIVQCCVCKKVRDDNGDWVNPPRNLQEATHTYCPTCLAEARQQLLKQQQATK